MNDALNRSLQEEDFERRVKFASKHHHSLTVCSVCQHSVDPTIDAKSQMDLNTGEWFHGPCFRFHKFVTAVERYQ
jgi:hypothetical protein